MPDEHTVKIEVAAAKPDEVDAKGGGVTSFTEDDIKTAREEAAKEARETAKAEFAEQAAKEAATQHRNDAKAFCETLTKEGKLAPADKRFMLELMNSISPSLEFGEDDDKKSVYSELKARLAATEKSALFGEVTPVGDKGVPKMDYRENDEDVRAVSNPEAGGKIVHIHGEKADKNIKAYRAKHDCSYQEACDATNFGEKEAD